MFGHLVGDTGCEHLGLQALAVHEHRREQRVEARHPGKIEDSRPDNRDIDRAVADVVDRGGLEVSPAGTPLVLEVDA